MLNIKNIELKLQLEKMVIGLEEPILIKGAGKFIAKVDSGNAGYNVIHGEDFVRQGDILNFKTYDADGNERRISKKISDTLNVHIGGGNIQERPVVELDIKFADEDYKKVPFSVTDRSKNSEKVLISKDFVQNQLDALIDVSKTNMTENEPVEVEYVNEGLTDFMSSIAYGDKTMNPLNAITKPVGYLAKGAAGAAKLAGKAAGKVAKGAGKAVKGTGKAVANAFKSKGDKKIAKQKEQIQKDSKLIKNKARGSRRNLTNRTVNGYSDKITIDDFYVKMILDWQGHLLCGDPNPIETPLKAILDEQNERKEQLAELESNMFYLENPSEGEEVPIKTESVVSRYLNNLNLITETQEQTTSGGSNTGTETAEQLNKEIEELKKEIEDKEKEKNDIISKLGEFTIYFVGGKINKMRNSVSDTAVKEFENIYSVYKECADEILNNCYKSGFHVNDAYSFVSQIASAINTNKKSKTFCGYFAFGYKNRIIELCNFEDSFFVPCGKDGVNYDNIEENEYGYRKNKRRGS